MAKQQSDSSYEGMVAVFELMLTFLTYLGARYNPGPAHLKLPALQARLASLKAHLNDVSLAKAAYNAAISNRAAWYTLLPDLATRLLNMLVALSPQKRGVFANQRAAVCPVEVTAGGGRSQPRRIVVRTVACVVFLDVGVIRFGHLLRAVAKVVCANVKMLCICENTSCSY